MYKHLEPHGSPVAVFTKRLGLTTKAEGDIIGITEKVRNAVEESRLATGVATAFVSGLTAAVTTIEYEPGLTKDLPGAPGRTAPRSIHYEHQNACHDDNGQSHVKASLVDPSLSVPFVRGRLTLAAWQQIMFLEPDVSPRNREVVVQIIGEQSVRSPGPGP